MLFWFIDILIRFFLEKQEFLTNLLEKDIWTVCVSLNKKKNNFLKRKKFKNSVILQ